MKILFVSSFFPYPLYSGGQVRLYNLLRNLSKKHDITLVCEVRGVIDPNYTKEISKYCNKILTVVRKKQWSVKNILKTGFSLHPFLQVGHHSPEMKKLIEAELSGDKYDLIHAETFYIMQNIPKTTLPIILTEHNVEYDVYKKWVDSFWFFPLRPLLYLDILKLKLWEEKYWFKADKLLAVSDTDQKIMESEIKRKVEVVPNGVDFGYFSEINKTEPKVPTIVFAGSFKWMQNKDAVFYLLKRLWPGIKIKMKEKVRLWIVGNNAKSIVNRITDNLVKVENRVSDIRRVYSSATILLAPIRIGGGTKFKILESMASGLPVVTTPMGVLGMGQDTNGILIGKDAEELINQSVRLLTDRALRNEISHKEKLFINKNFDWKDISRHLDEIYHNVTTQRI